MYPPSIHDIDKVISLDICRMDVDSYTQYKAMIIATGLHLLLLMFELLMCDKLNSERQQMLWMLVFIPLFCISIASIGLCVWALKHGRTFEVILGYSCKISSDLMIQIFIHLYTYTAVSVVSVISVLPDARFAGSIL